jgi:hypothetical protein
VDMQAEFVVASAEILYEGVPALTTRAERSCFSRRMGRSRAFTRL